MKDDCKSILSKYAEKLSHPSLASNQSFLDAAEIALVYEALQRHPKADAKIGCGVKAIFVQRDRFGSFCFHLQRVDGSEEDFSYKKLFRMSKSEQKHRIGYTWDESRNGAGRS
jgi:Protein of unknown function (DUF3223)